MLITLGSITLLNGQFNKRGTRPFHRDLFIPNVSPPIRASRMDTTFYRIVVATRIHIQLRSDNFTRGLRRCLRRRLAEQRDKSR